MNNKGFTLIELLLVVMIIGFMLAVILPRGLRATTDAKYNLVRQNAAELAAYGNDWVEQQILAQNDNSTSTRATYLNTLVTGNAAWIASASASNWNDNSGPLIVFGRRMNTLWNVPPENSVEEIIDPAKVPRNPFNGANFFNTSNDPANPSGWHLIPGAIACTVAQDSSTGGTFDYYAFIFQGTDSTMAGPAATVDYHAGMAAAGTLAGAREGIFFTKVRQ